MEEYKLFDAEYRLMELVWNLEPVNSTALAKREQVRQYESAAVVERGFGGSLPAFVAAFLREKKLSPQEADELRRMLDESEGGHD